MWQCVYQTAQKQGVRLNDPLEKWNGKSEEHWNSWQVFCLLFTSDVIRLNETKYFCFSSKEMKILFFFDTSVDKLRVREKKVLGFFSIFFLSSVLRNKVETSKGMGERSKKNCLEVRKFERLFEDKVQSSYPFEVLLFLNHFFCKSSFSIRSSSPFDVLFLSKFFPKVSKCSQ